MLAAQHLRGLSLLLQYYCFHSFINSLITVLVAVILALTGIYVVLTSE